HCTLAPGIPTFPRVLRDAGYRTKAVGKMHFTPTYLDVGFEEMLLAEQDGPGRFDDDYHRWLRDEGLVDAVDIVDQRSEYREKAPRIYWDTLGALQSDLDEAHHSTTWIAERALETLDRWDTGGNLLMVGFVKPHHPFDPPAPWDDLYDPELLGLLPGWLETPLARDIARHSGYFPHAEMNEGQLRRAMAYYYATISQIDHHVGRMVALLKQRDLYNDTLVVYTSDHGDYMGFHHLLLKGNFMYDPVVRVPLIVKFPGNGRAGEVSSALVNNIDVAPTLLRAAGCEVPQAMQGQDLTAGSAGRTIVFAENWGGAETMVRTATHKLLLCRDPAQSQFYDLLHDPLELDNRINDPAYADAIRTLRETLLTWALFDARTQTYLDYNAPRAAGENVPSGNDGHVEAQTAYFRRILESEQIF
ncbi:MAG: sulfatase-like hydrolase/transferase, partial [Anaerolineae bacterium]|nr:sulfatase-like hydrolase/transferase [Anaerolineae bacterium]